MPTPTFPAIPSKDFTDSSNRMGSFDIRSVFEVVRNLFFSSILWLLLAIALYAVYSLVVGSR